MSQPKQRNEEIDMADHDDKKNVQTKGKGTPPYEQEQKPGPEECEPRAIEAESHPGGSSLRVVVSEGKDPTTPQAHRIAGVRVTLISGSSRQSQSTGPQGEVRWPGLEPGDYEVEVASPKGYHPRETTREQVNLIEGEEALIHIGLGPEEATLKLVAFHDAKRCGDPQGQTRIKNLRFEALRGTKSLGARKTEEDGTGSLKLPHSGWVELEIPGLVRDGDLALRPAAGERQLVLLEPGKETEVRVAFVSRLADLTVEALLESEDKGQLIPLPGVSLDLYAPGSLVPIHAVTADWSVVFSDLEEGTYTIAVTPPQHYQGRAIELVDGSQERTSVIVRPGASTPLSLRFHYSRCRVEGCVRGRGLQTGWEGIPLRLVPLQGGPALSAVTQARGEFVFDGVPPGPYDVELTQSKVFHGNRSWRIASDQALRQRVLARAGAPVAVEPFVLNPEEHTLSVQVLDPDDKPLPYAAFEVLTDGGQSLGLFSTDEMGKRKLPLGQAGGYQVRYRDDGTVFQSVQVNEDVAIALHTRRGGGGFSAPRFQGGGGDAVLDIPYPILTEGAMGAQGGWPSSAPPASADLGQQVQGALREVLNWRSSGYGGDAKGFVNALNQSFSLRQIEGHTEFTWTPRSYAAVQSGLGALTGAQASIYTRAKVALDQVLPLLAGLYPLRADADEQDTEALRAIVRSGFTELVNELATEGGPRVLRVDDLFRQLVDTTNSDPEQVRGQLGQLASLFGLQRRRVNTIDEEQNLTNFLICADYVLGLQQSWLTQRRFFTRGSGSEPFLGTQLVLVERSLAVVSESVREVYLAMDSVFLGREERQVVELRFPNEPSLFVAELLGWIDQVASNEGPQLIKDGGKQGVISFQPTVDRLATLAAGALIPPQNPADLPAGYRTARVQRALQELADHLSETSQLVQQIRQQAA